MTALASDSYLSVKIRAGAASYELACDVESLTVDDDATRPNQLAITVGDPFRVLGNAVREGMEVEVEIGSLAEHALTFRGRTHQIEGEFTSDAVPKLKLVAHDDRMRMGLRQRSRRFTDMALSEVVRQVGGTYFSDVRVEVTGDPSFGENGIRQDRQTDLGFLLALAEEFECELLLEATGEHDALRFVSSSILRDQAPVTTLHHGRLGANGMLSGFHPRVDLARRRLSRSLASFDPDTGEETGTYSRRTGGALEVRDDFFDDNMSHFATEHPNRSVQLGALMAAAEVAAVSLVEDIGTRSLGSAPPFLSPDQRAARERHELANEVLGMQARAEIDGPLFVRTASVIRIENVGARFSGDWYVLKVRHVFDTQGRRTELECER